MKPEHLQEAENKILLIKLYITVKYKHHRTPLAEQQAWPSHASLSRAGWNTAQSAGEYFEAPED